MASLSSSFSSTLEKQLTGTPNISIYQSRLKDADEMASNVLGILTTVALALLRSHEPVDKRRGTYCSAFCSEIRMSQEKLWTAIA